jgi:hypothetical protein
VFKLVENVAKNLPKNFQKSEEKCGVLPLYHGLPQSLTYNIFWVNFFKTFPTNIKSQVLDTQLSFLGKFVCLF